MADAPNLGTPPKTLTRAQVLAKLKRKDEVVEVDGLGMLRGRSLTVEDMTTIKALAMNGHDEADPVLVMAYSIARTFPDAFQDRDVKVIRESQPALFAALIDATSRVNADLIQQGKEAANVPLSFRKDAGTRKRVPGGKRAGSRR